MIEKDEEGNLRVYKFPPTGNKTTLFVTPLVGAIDERPWVTLHAGNNVALQMTPDEVMELVSQLMAARAKAIDRAEEKRKESR